MSLHANLEQRAECVVMNVSALLPYILFFFSFPSSDTLCLEKSLN